MNSSILPPNPTPAASSKRSASSHDEASASKKARPSPEMPVDAPAEMPWNTAGTSANIRDKFAALPFSAALLPHVLALQSCFIGPDSETTLKRLFLVYTTHSFQACRLVTSGLPRTSCARVSDLVSRYQHAARAAVVFESDFVATMGPVRAHLVEVLAAPAAASQHRENSYHLDRMRAFKAARALQALVAGACRPAELSPPAPRLVGIETNPGPSSNRAKKKAVVVVTKKKGGSRPKVALVVKGRGDYRPTAFARTRGHGDYISDAVGGLGSRAGKFLGDKVGGMLSSVASPFLKLLGMGDYRTEGPKSNSLYQRDHKAPVSGHHQIASMVGGNPNPMNMGACSVEFGARAPRVTHREYIGPIYGGTGFRTKLYRIQPGLIGPLSMFPWGASIAKSFQQYRLCGMILEYKSTSSNYSAGTALGTVMMSTLYDAEATALASVAEIDNNDFTTSDAPCNSFIHPIECASDKNTVDVRYVRTSNTSSATTDDRLADVGLFQISTNGLSADETVQIGELWASYDIEFLKPALIDQHIGTTFQATGTYSGGAASHSPFTGIVLDPQNSLPCVLQSSSLTLPAAYNGNYLVTYTVSAATATVNSFSLVAAGSDITALKLFQNTTGTGVASVLSAGLSQPTYSYSYALSTIANNAPVVNNTIQFGAVGLSVASTTYWTLLVVPLDNDITSYRTRALKMLSALPDEAFLRSYVASLGPLEVPEADDVDYEECKGVAHRHVPASSCSSPGISDRQGPSAFFFRK